MYTVRPGAPLLLASLLVLLVTGCGRGYSPATATGGGAAHLLAPAAFARELASGIRTVINVHTPDEGSIPGTDLAVPFDLLVDYVDELPANRNQPLAVYCKSGRMSKEAVMTLAGLGYTDIVELQGGMDAWIASGRKLAESDESAEVGGERT